MSHGINFFLQREILAALMRIINQLGITQLIGSKGTNH